MCRLTRLFYNSCIQALRNRATADCSAVAFATFGTGVPADAIAVSSVSVMTGAHLWF